MALMARHLSRGKFLGAAIALGQYLKKTYPEKRIGIVMPPGKGGVLANLAVTLARKSPREFEFHERARIDRVRDRAG